MKHKPNIVATFSIVGHDPETGELGVAVQSKFLGVGSVVPWAKAGVGAIATQALANPAYGPAGLKLLKEGLSAQETLDELVKNDPQADERQAGIIDANGNGVTYTGANCLDWAGGITGPHYCAQGNILVNQATVTEMGKAFEQHTGSLSDRLIAGLQAAQNAGGDSRGRQSAAIYVVKDKGGYGGLNDVFVDLRVDDHPNPIEELNRIYQLQQLYFGESKAENIKRIEGPFKVRLTGKLHQLGYLSTKSPSDQELYKGLKTFINTENFEGREQKEGYIDMQVYNFMENQ